MNSNFNLLRRLVSKFDYSRRMKFFYLILLMILSSLAEVFSIGAILPFLAVITSPEILMENEMLASYAISFGYETPSELIVPLTIIFLASVIFASLLRIGQLIFNTKMAFSAGSEISVIVFKNALSQSYLDHKISNSSELISTLATKIDDVIYRTIQPALQLISSVILIIFIVSFLMLINPTVIILSVLILSIIYILISQLCYKLLASDSDNIALMRDRIVKISSESFASIRDIIISKSYSIHENRFNSADQSLRKSQASILILSNIPRYILEAVTIVIIVSIAFIYRDGTSGFTVIALLGAIAMAGQKLLPAFQQVYGSWATIVGNISPLSDVVIMLEKSVVNHSASNVCKVSFNNEIKLDSVTFSYPGKAITALENINFSIKKNSCVAIIGSTGGGKSTLMDIVLGLLNPDSGGLYIDEFLINDQSTIDSWHTFIAHVPQHVYLSDVTIAENISQCSSIDEVNEERLVGAAKDAEILSFIESLPERFNTIVGENGSNFSGGQRQRIGIAKALYRESPVIVLDEATSALDKITEHKIIDNICNTKGRTVFMVSHRLESLKRCDLIVEIHSGKVGAVGTYDELVNSSNYFKKLSLAIKN